MLGIAVVLAVGAFFVLRPAEEAPQRAQITAAEPPADGSGNANPASQPKPKLTVIRTKGGRPVGDVRDITVSSGETVGLEVRSDVPEEVHVHGYDRYIQVGPERSGKARFKADLEGVYEVELHGSAEEIASLRVEP